MFEWKLNFASKSTDGSEEVFFLCIYRNYWNNDAKQKEKKGAQIAFKIHFIAGVPSDYSRLHRNHFDRKLHFMCVSFYFSFCFGKLLHRRSANWQKELLCCFAERRTYISFYSNPFCVYVFFSIHSFIHYYEHISAFFSLFFLSFSHFAVCNKNQKKEKFFQLPKKSTLWPGHT